MRRPDTIAALAGAGLLALGLGLPGAAGAQGIACGEAYAVTRGDSLSRIAERAYGEAASFQIIYSANAEAIGPNPALIRVGMELDIPCLEATTASTADASVIRREETTERLPAPALDTIRILTAGNWAPFLDENQEQGGMFVEIANVAMENADGSPDYKIDFINDWGAHLQPLLSDHAYDLGLAWFRPNCDVAERLGPGSQFRCNNLDWSEPIFEQIIGYYMRADAARPESHADLFGMTVCRPAGYSNFMLEEHGLVEPNVTRVAGDGPQDCFTGLVEGRYDVVVLATDVSDATLTDLDIRGKVTHMDHLSQVATLHAVTAKTHPRGPELIEVFDSGLVRIKSDQRWFEIVRRHLAEHKARTSG